MHSKIENIAIVGLGLLGSSLAASLKQNNSNLRIVGISSPNSLEKAISAKVIDEAFSYEDVDKWISTVQLAFICTPISHIKKFLQTISNCENINELIISDVGSTKNEICNLANEILPKNIKFIGGHPMAGSEKNGFDAMDPYLYENAYWILTPHPDHSKEENKEIIAKVGQVVEKTGSNLVILDAKTHDKIMASLSHAPQLIASALAASVSQKEIIDKNYLHLAGRGFRDTTRIAASSYNMWRDIFTSNKDEVSKAIVNIKETIDELYKALINLPASEPKLKKVFEKGIINRTKLSEPGKSYNQGLSELTITMIDEPGMILKVMTPLSNAKINILDIELLKVREGIDGTLLLAFKSLNDAKRAKAILTEHKFNSRIR